MPLVILIALVASPAHLVAQTTVPPQRTAANPVSAALAAPPTTAPPAEILLARSVLFLENYHSLTADVAYQADLLGHRLDGKGSYREVRSGPRPRVRLEIQMPLDNKMGAMVELSDGQYLWTYVRLADDEKLTQVNIRRLVEALKNPDEPTQPIPLTSSIGLGGLAGFVRELQRNFRFEIVGPSQFLGEPAWQLLGRWQPDRLAVVLPNEKDAIARGETVDLRKLSPHLPSEVLLTLGRDNLLPYCIEYRRPSDAPDGGSRVFAAPADQTILVLKWFNIGRNEPVNPADFEYRPGDLEILDATNTLIDRIKPHKK